MDSIRKKQLTNGILWGLGILGFVLLLPLTLPVVLGIGAAALLDPLILRLQKNTGMGRSAASALCVTGALATVTLTLWLLGRILLRELGDLSRQLPQLLSNVAGYAEALSRWLEALSRKLPDGVGDALGAWAQEILSGSGSLASGLYDRIFSLVSRTLSALPGSLFFLMTLVLSCYFAAGELPRLRELLGVHLPRAHHRRLTALTTGIRSALGGWLRAQLSLMGVTFLVLTMGFLLLGVDSPLLLGLVVALLDALPLLGTGTVLIPWALVRMAAGDVALGLGLLGLYGAAALIRNILEPKLLGAQLGLSPLLTLVAIYAGWRLGGFWGMLLLPMGAMVLSQLWQSARGPLGQPFSFMQQEKAGPIPGKSEKFQQNH